MTENNAGNRKPTTVNFGECEHPELVRALLNSDIEYFRAAAECEEVEGFQILYMPGLQSLAAGCVVLSDAHRGTSPCVESLERRLGELGCAHARIYQQYPHRMITKLMFDNGYPPVEEIALLSVFGENPSETSSASGISLSPIETEGDWRRKLTLQRYISQGPDGHVSRAELWVEMERRKCEAGYMSPFFILNQDQICGAVNYAPLNCLGRLKNLVIHPNYRRKGVGVQAARLIATMAREQGKKAAGCFALAQGESINLYQAAGYLPVSHQVEWYKDL